MAQYDDNIVETIVTGVNNQFNVSRFHKHELSKKESIPTFGSFRRPIASIFIDLDTLNGISDIPTLTLKATTDSAGDKIWLPDTDAVIAKGITTTTKGSVVFKFMLPISIMCSDDVFLWFKLDNGSCRVVKSIIIWEI